MQKIKVHLSGEDQQSPPREWTAKEVNVFLENGHYGMIVFEHITGEYVIDGRHYGSTGLTIGGETFIHERDGKIVVPTFFTEDKIVSGGDPHALIEVEAVIDPAEHPIFVTLTKQTGTEEKRDQ